jgi:tRNA (guanine37-N1)-methyltransferase
VKIDIVTIFPGMVTALTGEGIVGRAIRAGLVDLATVDLRDFTDDAHRTVDDAPFGGGPGMVLKAEPFFRAMARIEATRGRPDAVVLPSPQGPRFDHTAAGRLGRLGHVAFLCGRYEGVDERVREALVTEELSIGDYVLSGGELAALVMVDAAVRLLPQAVGDARSVEKDSFARGLLDHPHYTRPASWRGYDVPAVLLSGNHGGVRRWRKLEALRRTRDRRPDLLRVARLDDEEQALLKELEREEGQKEQTHERH